MIRLGNTVSCSCFQNNMRSLRRVRLWNRADIDEKDLDEKIVELSNIIKVKLTEEIQASPRVFG